MPQQRQRGLPKYANTSLVCLSLPRLVSMGSVLYRLDLTCGVIGNVLVIEDCPDQGQGSGTRDVDVNA